MVITSPNWSHNRHHHQPSPITTTTTPHTTHTMICHNPIMTTTIATSWCWRSGRGRGRRRRMRAYKVCSLFLFLMRRVHPPRHVIPSSWRDKEGPPSSSCHLFILDVTRRVCPPRYVTRVIPSFLMWRKGFILLVMSFLSFQHDIEGPLCSPCHSYHSIFNVVREYPLLCLSQLKLELEYIYKLCP